MFWTIGCVSGALSVAFGAFGAHGLKGRVDPSKIANWSTAAQYQVRHRISLLDHHFLKCSATHEMILIT